MLVSDTVLTPVEAIDTSISIAFLVTRNAIPLLDKDLKVLTDIRLKLKDRFGSKGMRDDLSLARMLSSVACVEETTTDRHKGIVEVTIKSIPILVLAGLRV